MQLLEIEGMVGIPSPHITHIKPFDEIIDRDDSEDNRQASRELAYIHLFCHYESPYASDPEESRHRRIVKDIYGDPGAWEPDDLVVQGMKKYRELTESEYIRLLNASREAANKLIDHFHGLKLEEPKDAKDAINNISKIGEVVEGIDKLKEQIEKNQSTDAENRAGVETNKYSEGDI